MCGRFSSALPADELVRIFATLGPVPNLPPNWNVAPTQPAVGVRRNPETGERTFGVLNWGLLPHFESDPKAARRPINARAETVASAPLFRGAFVRRRCLIPADAYYEWMAVADGKQPYAIARSDGAPLALGGLWEGHRSPQGEVTRSFAIITVAASPNLRPLHERMPLVLDPADWPAWLGETEADPRHLLQAAPQGTLRFWKVGRAVNSVRNNAASLLAPDPSTADAA